jgi:hypothetical protein
MPARGSRTASSAFTLFEVLVAIGLVAAALGTATTLLVSAHRRFRRATVAADARVRLAFATDRMLADVRGSSGTEVDEGALVLVHPEGKVTWCLREGDLVRVAGGGESAYDVRLSEMRVAVGEGEGTAPFVEVVLELAGSGREGGSRHPARGVYLAASPRLAKAADPEAR